MARLAVGVGTPVTTGLSIARARGMAGQVLASGRPLRVDDLSTIELADSALRDRGLRSVLAVPIHLHDQVLGVMYVASLTPAKFIETDAKLLELAADRMATTMDGMARLRSERALRTDAEALARRLERLQTLTSALARAATREAVVEVVEEQLVDLGDPDVAIEATVCLGEGWEGGVPDAVGPRSTEGAAPGPAHVIGAAEVAHHVPSRRASGHRSATVLPLTRGDEPIGALVVSSPVPDAFGQSERRTLASIAEQVSQALERVRRREVCDAMARFSAFLADAVREMAEAPDLQSALEHLAVLGFPVLGEICLIDVVDEGGGVARVVARHWDPSLQHLVERLRTEFPPDPGGRHPAARALREATTSWSNEMTEEFLRTTTRSEEHLRLVQELGFRSYLTVPLVSGTVLGSMTYVATSTSFEEEEVRFAEELARHVAGAIANVQQVRTSLMLQRSLLPGVLPTIPGVRVCGRYLAGTEDLDVGGDFYDVVVLDPDTVRLVIGDVAGHGREAAAMMGQLRSAVRALSIGTPEVAEMVQLLQRGWEQLGFDRIATACFVDIRTEHRIEHRTEHRTAVRTATVVSAGHYPPLLITPDGPQYAPVRPGLPLGAGSGEERITTWRTELLPGTVVVLYTDGLINERGRGVDASMQRLTRRVAGAGMDPAEICDRAVATVDWRRIDDLALLAVVVE